MSVYEMTGAYAVFARDGIYTDPYVYTVVTDSDGNVVLAQDGYDVTFDAAGQPIITGYATGEPVLAEHTVRQMDLMLTSVVTDGTGKKAQMPGIPAAGKTGTTDDDYDRWFAGYTSKYTAAVWTGYENAETINYDGNPSIELWRQMMERIN
jgi:penicillin-binding protein 1A